MIRRYLSQLTSEMPDSLQKDSTTCTPQYEFTSFITMATYRVSDLPDIKSFAGRLSRSFYFNICQWSLIPKIQHTHNIYVRSSLGPFKTFFEHKITNIKWNQTGETGEEWAAMGTKFSTLNYYPFKFQWSLLKINRDGSIYTLDVILGWENDVISLLIGIFYTLFKILIIYISILIG